MKRLLILALVIVLAIAGLAAAMPLLLSSKAFKQPIADQLANWTGRKVSFVGDPHVSVFPHLKIWVPQFTMAGAAGAGGDPLVTADRLVGTVRLWPLLVGRVEVIELGLRRARVHLKVDESGKPNWLIGPAPAMMDDGEVTPLRAADLRLGRVAVRESSIVYDDEAAGKHETFQNVDLNVAWPVVKAVATVVGAFQWRGEAVEFNGSMNDPLAFAAGKPSPVRFAVASTPLRVSFSGNATDLGGVNLQGTANISTPSLRRVFSWTGFPMEPASTLGAASIEGKVNWADRAATFTEAHAELDGNIAEGMVIANFAGERPHVQTTLDFAKLDLSPYLDSFRSENGPGLWSSAPMSMPLVSAADFDARLSMGEILLGSVRLGRAAVTASAVDGRLDVNVTEAQLYGGSLAARIKGELRDGSLTANLTADMKEVPAGVALADIAGLKSVDGTGTASLTVGGSGRTVGEFLHGLAGTAKMAISDGTLEGLQLDRVVTMLGGAGGAASDTSGATSFSAATCTLDLADGTLRTSDLRAEGKGFRIDLAAEASLSDTTVSGRGSLTLDGASADSAPMTVLPFELTGTWLAPELLPDFQRLIRRSSGDPNRPWLHAGGSTQSPG